MAPPADPVRVAAAMEPPVWLMAPLASRGRGWAAAFTSPSRVRSPAVASMRARPPVLLRVPLMEMGPALVRLTPADPPLRVSPALRVRAVETLSTRGKRAPAERLPMAATALAVGGRLMGPPAGPGGGGA